MMAASRSNPGRRGVALVLVLWLVVVLGTIAAGVVMATRTSTALASNARAQAVARYAAESGIEATVAAIEDSLLATPDTRAQQDFLNVLEEESAVGDSVALGDARFAVVIIDPSARLDVNAAPVENLTRLFAHFTDAGRASDIARAIRQRIERGAESTASDAVFQRAGELTVRTVYPLRTLDELRTIEGIDQGVLQLAAPYMTVDGDGTINQRAASDTVLEAAFGELRDAPSRLVLVSRGWMRGHPLTREIQAVYAISNERLVLVHWRERAL
jgi:general secretion pathway protein K